METDSLGGPHGARNGISRRGAFESVEGIESATMKSTRNRSGAGASAASSTQRRVYALAANENLRTELAGYAAAFPDSAWQEFSGGHDFLRQAHGLAAGAVLIFDPLPDIETLSIVTWLGEQKPDLAAVVVSTAASVETAVGCLKAGAADFLTRPTGREAVLAALAAVFGPVVERPTRNMALRRHWMSNRLSQREMQVLQALLGGLSNKAIGIKLSISERTVEVHRSRIMRRLEVESFAQLVRMAVQAGLD